MARLEKTLNQPKQTSAQKCDHNHENHADHQFSAVPDGIDDQSLDPNESDCGDPPKQSVPKFGTHACGEEDSRKTCGQNRVKSQDKGLVFQNVRHIPDIRPQKECLPVVAIDSTGKMGTAVFAPTDKKQVDLRDL